MHRNSKWFSNVLSKSNISKITATDAKKIYRGLHSGEMRARRFHADSLFVQENTISKIRTSLTYLLYSNNELALRIHNMLCNPKYYLNQLGASGVQELIGWVNANKYPLRNDKANKAIKLIGYKI